MGKSRMAFFFKAVCGFLATSAAAQGSCQTAKDPEQNGKEIFGVYVDTTYSDQIITDYSKCIYVVAGNYKTWNAAKQWCKDNVPKACSTHHCDGNLVSFHNQAQTDAAITKVGYAPGTYWMGLRQHCAACEFEWSDLSPVDYTAWFDSEPNNSGDGEDCVTFTYHAEDQQNIDGKYWNDDGCFKEFSFICEAYDSDFHQEQDPWPTFGGCKAGWEQFAGGCYRLFGHSGGHQSGDNDWKQFHDANAACAQTWPGATLAVFPNPYYQFFASSMMNQLKQRVWIGGLTTSNQDHFFHWIDNSKMTFTNWQPGEPNGQNTGENVVEMTFMSEVNRNTKVGEWNDMPAEWTRPYMCSHPVSSSESGTGPNPLNCPQGWKAFRSFCYKIDSTSKSFDDATAACQTSPDLPSGGRSDLVSITDDYEFNFVRSMIYRSIDKPPQAGSLVQDGAWIGLTATKKGDAVSYQWNDQFLLANTFWDTNQPNDKNIPSSGRGCVVMNLPYGNWAIADNCSKGLPYVCKMNPSPKGSSLADYRGAPLDCQDSFQTFSGDSAHCYKAFPEKVDWFEASKKCQRLFNGAGHLLSVHTDEMNQAASSLYKSVDEGNFHVGGRRNDVNGFGWTDKSEFSYTKWAPNEPSGSWGGVPENCLEVHKDTYWNDIPCSTTNGYVCQVPRQYSNCAVVLEKDKVACAALAEHQCDQEKCCWDPTSVIKCFKPDGTSTGSGSMTPGKAAGIVSGVFIALNVGALVYFSMFFRR